MQVWFWRNNQDFPFWPIIWKRQVLTAQLTSYPSTPHISSSFGLSRKYASVAKDVASPQPWEPLLFLSPNYDPLFPLPSVLSVNKQPWNKGAPISQHSTQTQKESEFPSMTQQVTQKSAGDRINSWLVHCIASKPYTYTTVKGEATWGIWWTKSSHKDQNQREMVSQGTRLPKTGSQERTQKTRQWLNQL